jgi:hypothetical protein
VHLVGFLFIVVIAGARNHEPEICKSYRENQNYINGNLTTVLLSTDYDGSNTAGECRMFRQFVIVMKMKQDARVELNPGLPWQKRRSKRRRIFFFRQQIGFEFK